MIKTLDIENVGNIKSLSVELGKVNVFIGANLAGQEFIFKYIKENHSVPEGGYALSTTISQYIKNLLIDYWFAPMIKELKLYWGYDGYTCSYKSELNDKWQENSAIDYVVNRLISVLNPFPEDVVLEGLNFGDCLNPRLARRLLREMIELAEENGKQLIIFTHQPNVLDALDLNNDDHRLFTVGFWRDASCRVIRIDAPNPLEGQEPVRLSEAFMRGYIGGLPKGF